MKIEKRGDPFPAMLVAAQIIHEGLHQKHTYLCGCEDTNSSVDDQRGFIRPEFSGVPMTSTWGGDHCWNHFFSLAASVGFEILFLEYLLRTQRLRPEGQDFFRRRLKRKRGYLLPLLVQAELLRHYFSPEGESVLGELFRSFGYRAT